MCSLGLPLWFDGAIRHDFDLMLIIGVLGLLKIQQSGNRILVPIIGLRAPM